MSCDCLKRDPGNGHRLDCKSPSPAPLDEDELRIALANVGVDITCPACAELFYTGHRNAKHTHVLTPQTWMHEQLINTRERLRIAEVVRDDARAASQRDLLLKREAEAASAYYAHHRAEHDLTQLQNERDAVAALWRTETAELRERLLDEKRKVGSLRIALIGALDQLRRHDSDRDYNTPKVNLEVWNKLIKETT